MPNYLFATKALKCVCIQYTDEVDVKLVDYLHDHNWRLEPSDPYFYVRKEDRYGGRIQTLSVDVTTKKLDI